MTHILKKVLLWYVVIMLVSFLTGVGIVMFFGFSQSSSREALNKPLPPIPQAGIDDAYPHYVAMIRSMRDYRLDNKSDGIIFLHGVMHSQDLQKTKLFINNYEENLHEMELGVQKETCTMPFRKLPEGKIPYSLVTAENLDTGYGKEMEQFNIVALQNIALLMLFRGQLALAENHPEDAIRDYSSVIQLGRHIHQGPYQYRLMGINLQRRAYKQFQEMLSKPESIKYADKIETALSRFSTPMILDNKDIGRYEMYLRWNDVIQPGKGKWDCKVSTQDMIDADYLYDGVNALYGLCRTSALIRLYQSKHNGKFPPNILNLAPEYISELPHDPYNNADFIYKISKDGKFVTLHSLGPNASIVKSSEENWEYSDRLKRVELLKSDLEHTLFM